MGNKSDRKGQYLAYHLAIGCITALICTAACAPLQQKVTEIQAHRQLEQYREKLADGFFESVIEQSEQVLAEGETKPPADVALYALGEVYAHTDYRGQDFVLSQYYFEKLRANFPASPLTSEARVYISLFEKIAKKERETIELKRKSTQIKPQVVYREKQIEVPSRGRVVKGKDFQTALTDNLELLKKSGSKKPADEALYNLGLIYAHGENPMQDLKQSRHYFTRLLQQFPQSSFGEEAEVWLGLFKTIEKLKQIDLELDRQRKQLSQ